MPRSNHSAPPHEGTRLEGAMGTLGSSTSLPLSTLSSPYCPEHTLPLLETLREDSPRVEEKGKTKAQNSLENFVPEKPARMIVVWLSMCFYTLHLTTYLILILSNQ